MCVNYVRACKKKEVENSNDKEKDLISVQTILRIRSDSDRVGIMELYSDEY